MGSHSSAASLQLPVNLRGIQLGRPVDLLLDPDSWNVLGFVVLCGDASRRFLPFAASQLLEAEIAVNSALMLLEDGGFYEKRGVSLRSLLGEDVAGGTLRDVTVDELGHAIELIVEREGRRVVAPVPARAAA